MNRNNFINSRKLALSGILLALAVLTLYAESIVPTSKLSLYALSSFFVSVIVMESGIKAGWLFYIASSLLALILIPDKIGLIPYLIFFGIYGILKFYIEKLNRLVPEYTLKMIYFNACLATAYFFVKEFFLGSVRIDYPWWAVVIGIEIVFVVYDYVYTMFIQYYNQKLKKILRL